ncbi:MAG: hypothetical protein KDC35_07450 [Acidobacteria bacterium]|nr:hypothetical protein [Acidobacteriota bacterium]
MSHTEYRNYEIHAKLMELVRTDFTGSLTTRPEKRKMFFQKGNLVYANSDIDGESFADILTEMNVLSPNVLEQLKGDSQQGLSLGKRIRDDGLASPNELALALKQQIMRVVSRVVNTESGAYELVYGNLPPKIPILKIYTLPLFVKSFLLVEDPEFPVDIPEGLTLQLNRNLDKYRDDLNLPLNYLEALNSIQQTATIERIANQSTLDIRQAKRLAYTLVMLGTANLVAQERETMELGDDELEDLSADDLLDELDSASTLPDGTDIKAQLEDTIFGRLPVTAQDLDPMSRFDTDTTPDLSKQLAEKFGDAEAAAADPVSELNRVLSETAPHPSLHDQPSLIDETETVPARPLDTLMDDSSREITYDEYDADDLALDEDAQATAPMPTIHDETVPATSQQDLRERGFILPETSESSFQVTHSKPRKSKLPLIVGVIVVLGLAAAGYFKRDQLMELISPRTGTEPTTETTQPLEPQVPDEATESLAESESKLPETSEPEANESENLSPGLEPDEVALQLDNAPQENVAEHATSPDPSPTAAQPQAGSFEYYDSLAKDHVTMLRASQKRYAIAFTVACEMTTLDQHFANHRNDPDLYILPRRIGNRPCFIAMWGLFASKEGANQAMARMPKDFVSTSDPPWIIHLDQYL